MEDSPANKTSGNIPFFSSINFRFILIFVLLVAATMLLSGFILIYQSRNFLQDAILKENLAEAQNIQIKINNFIQQAKGKVELIATMPGVKDLDLFAIDKMMYEVIGEREMIEPVAVLNEEGVEIASREASARRKNRSSEELFRKSKKSSYVSDVYFSDSNPFIIIASPILDYDNNGKRIGILVMAVKLRNLGLILDDVKLGRKSSIIVTDEGGRTIYYTDKAQPIGVTRFKDDDAVRLALRQNKGSGCFGRSLCAYLPLEGIKGAVVIQQPADEALYGVAKMQQQSLFLLSVSILLAIIIGLILAESMLDPLKKLILGTKIVGEGDLTYKIDVKTKDEIGELARSFNNMTTELLKQRERAVTDELTRLYTHSYFVETLKAEVYRAKRYRTLLSLLMLDIDHFKSFNDNYGHQVGDEVLIKISEMLKKNLRESDIAARYGGEELVVLAPETDKQGILFLAERIRNSIDKKLEIEYEGNKLRITVSVGVTSLTDEDIKEDVFPDDFLKRVDVALYRAKEGGRNCVVQI